MPKSPPYSHHLDWPAPGSRLRGPMVWLRGWIVGKPGHDFCDVRVCIDGQTHLGVLGFPRRDLAAHLSSVRDWLPAGFVVGVPLPNGTSFLTVEAQDFFGHWHPFQILSVTIAPDGEFDSRQDEKLLPPPSGRWSVSGAPRPFHGHLDVTPGDLRHGRVPLFGWLLHEEQALAAVFATSDLMMFNHLTHGITDVALGDKLPAWPQARHSRLRGEVDVPPTLASPACLRVYAQLADGLVQLCFVQRLAQPVAPAATIAASPKTGRPAAPLVALRDLPSGRPRRLLLATLSLSPDDATLRALDLGRHLVATNRWAVRVITTADGPLRSAFEAAGIAVQIVELHLIFTAVNATELEKSIAGLERKIWWRHLDAVAVFDPLCFWAITLAHRRNVPVLFDCSGVEALGSTQQTSPIVAAAMLAGWKAASFICYPSIESARGHAELFDKLPAVVVPHWTNVTDPSPRQAGVVAPISGASAHGAVILLRAADWLARSHPDFPWRIAVTGLHGDEAGRLFTQDAAFNRLANITLDPIDVTTATACVCPAFSGHPIRALLDAAAASVPIITTTALAVESIFSPSEAVLLPAGNPLALAHALADLVANPAAAARRAAHARAHVLTHHAASDLIARWQSILETMVATGS